MGTEPQDVAHVGFLGRHERFHGGEIRQLQRGEQVVEGDLLHLELLLQRRPASEPALDLLGPAVFVLLRSMARMRCRRPTIASAAPMVTSSTASTPAPGRTIHASDDSQ